MPQARRKEKGPGWRATASVVQSTQAILEEEKKRRRVRPEASVDEPLSTVSASSQTEQNTPLRAFAQYEPPE